MKWIGQHIWDFISRFRNKVYFENLEGGTSTTALVVDNEGRVFTNTLSGLSAGSTVGSVQYSGVGNTFDAESAFKYIESTNTLSVINLDNVNRLDLFVGADSTGSMQMTYDATKPSMLIESDGHIQFRLNSNEATTPLDSAFTIKNGAGDTIWDLDESGNIKALGSIKDNNNDDRIDLNDSTKGTSISNAVASFSPGIANPSVRIYENTSNTNGSFYNEFTNSTLTANRTITLPDTTGTLALSNEDTTGNATTATALTSGNKTITGDLDITGSVGIGTTSPSASLHAYATTGIISESPSNASITIRRNDNAAYSALLKYHTGNSEKWVAGLSDSGDFTGSTGNEYLIGTGKTTPKLLINSAGKVGIGTLTPSEKLDVVGNIAVSGDVNISGNILPGITTIKILPRDFIADDDGRPVQIDDSTSGNRHIESHDVNPLFASVEIPPGFKATLVDIYGTLTSAVTVYEANINTRVVTSKGTGNIGTQINITDVTSSATNYLLIELAQASGEQVFGGMVTIAKA